jgi:hypothetical protein
MWPAMGDTMGTACTWRYLRSNQALDTTPLYGFYVQGRLQHVCSCPVTPFLRRSVAAPGNAYGLRPEDVEARLLRASGAMALLYAGVDTNLICLIGPWRSDAMLRYLQCKQPLSCRPWPATCLHETTTPSN